MTDNRHQITALQVRDYKRIREVLIQPAADDVLILIGGDNAQGKSSTLDAITAAFGGANAVASDPVRHGAEVADIRLVLAGESGEIQIHRTVSKDEDGALVHQLEVREDGVKARSPQKLLDAIRGARFLDPLAFLGLPAKDSSSQPGRPKCQRSTLLELVADADRLADLEKKKVKAFDKRTELGRDLKKAEGELARTGTVVAGVPIDVAALMTESRAIDEGQREVIAAAARFDAARKAEERLEEAIRDTAAEIERLQAVQAKRRAEMAGLHEATTAAAYARDNAQVSAGAGAARRLEIDDQIARATEHNARVAKAQADVERREKVAAEVSKLEAEQQRCTDAIAEIESRKAEILAKAKLPVPGLGIDDAGVTLDGVPLAQASSAQRLRVALGIAIAASPMLRDVWIKDGALLDEHSLQLVLETAKEAGVRVWIERVGSRDPGAIVIRDGGIVAE